MKYTIQKLDGRHSYRDYFGYYLGFSSLMSSMHGPAQFNDALKWFIDTYGWSAEVRQYHKMMRWVSNTNMVLPFVPSNATGLLTEKPVHCNPHWSWTNSYQDLRIYLASEQELVFFQLAHPVDQKIQ